MTPPMITSAATTTSAMILVGVPLAQPSRSKTVAVARVARIVSTVSQPTVSIQEMTAGSRLPSTPNAARLSTSVGADPRLPATATKPQKQERHARSRRRRPPWPGANEIPKPRTNEP